MSEKRKTISPIIGNYLKNLRIAKNLRQNELGEELGITGAYIGFVENAKRLPSVEVVKSYANYFGEPLETLLSLREMTIFETVDLLGDQTPPAIKNERNMIVHAKRPDIIAEDNAGNQYFFEAKANVKEDSANYKVTENGTLFFDGKIIPPNVDPDAKEKIVSAIQELTKLEDLKKLLEEFRKSKEEIEKIEAELLAREKELENIESQIADLENENKK